VNKQELIKEALPNILEGSILFSMIKGDIDAFFEKYDVPNWLSLNQVGMMHEILMAGDKNAIIDRLNKYRELQLKRASEKYKWQREVEGKKKKEIREDNMSKLITTTVGTSVITNRLYDRRFDTEITQLVEYRKTPRNKDEIVNDTVEKIKENLQNKRPNNYLTAELASLRAFKNNSELGISNDDVIALFSTDTEDGKFCAKVNEEVFKSLQWCEVLSPVVIEGLKTRRIREDEDISNVFKDAGLISLKRETERLLANNGYTRKYFNITGGFKATIPFITILAFEKGMSLFYLYEESNDLIVIDPPGEFNYSFDAMRDVTRIRREILA